MKYINKIFGWLLSNKKDKLFVIILALISAFASSYQSNRSLNKFKQEINNQISNIVNQKQVMTNINNGELPVQDVLAMTDENINKGQIKNFDSNDWIFSADVKPNKEGYYCPNYVGFPSWFMWTKNKYKVENSFSVTFSLLDNTKDNDKNPTLYVSFGDKNNDVPDVFFRFNIFDGDLNTLRLYDRNNDELFERSKNKFLLNDFVRFELSPIFPNERSSSVLLNPIINGSQQDKNGRIDFIPSKEFKTNLPFSSADQGTGFQYGIGVSKGDCFKIISSIL